jgi:hypothetical protein
MSFRIEALPRERFAHLFGMSEAELAARGVRRVIVDRAPGFPCRVSLQDAAAGEPVLLMNFEHHSAATPYRASHAIYVREHALTAQPAADEIPEQLTRRLLSVRAYDAEGMMREAEVVPGSELAPLIERLFADPATAYLHLHNAKPGCYAARVERA